MRHAAWHLLHPSTWTVGWVALAALAIAAAILALVLAAAVHRDSCRVYPASPESVSRIHGHLVLHGPFIRDPGCRP